MFLNLPQETHQDQSLPGNSTAAFFKWGTKNKRVRLETQMPQKVNGRAGKWSRAPGLTWDRDFPEFTTGQDRRRPGPSSQYFSPSRGQPPLTPVDTHLRAGEVTDVGAPCILHGEYVLWAETKVTDFQTSWATPRNSLSCTSIYNLVLPFKKKKSHK